MFTVTIENYRPIGKGCAIASFNCVIPTFSMTIRGLTLFDKGGSKWVSFPSLVYDKDGKKAYMPYIVLDKDFAEVFKNACLSALQPFFQKARPEIEESFFKEAPNIPF